MRRKEIVKYIIASVESVARCNCIITDYSKKDKYTQEYEYTTIEVLGRKHWKFGIWIWQTNDKKSYSIKLFGQHKWYIDKFKPTCSPFSFEFEVKKTIKKLPIPYIDERGVDAPDAVWDFAWAIRDIACSSLLARIKYYWEGKVFDFIVGDWWFYEIKEPINKWYKNYGMIIPLTITKWLYKLKFGKKISVNIFSCREFFSPKWDLQVVYNSNNEDEIYKIYHKINLKGKKLFLPNWLYDGYVHIVNTTDKNDTHRGFYYTKD